MTKQLSLALVAIIVATTFSILPKANAEQIKSISFNSLIKPGMLMASLRSAEGQPLESVQTTLESAINTGLCGEESLLTGTIGSDSARIYIENPNAAAGGWSLNIAPKLGEGAVWSSSSATPLDVNDNTGNGCLDGDNDNTAGLLSIDSSKAKVGADCKMCSNTSLVKGTSNANFAEYPVITLLSASADSNKIGRWYLTDVDISQTLPTGTQSGNYSLDLVLTATAS